MSSNQSQLQRVRHDIKIRRLRVEKIEDLSASLKRFTFSGDDLDSFASASFDDHLKAFFPNAAGELHLPQVGEKGVVFPEGVVKPAVREYTPTGIDLIGKRLALEFAIHDAGPATSWRKPRKWAMKSASQARAAPLCCPWICNTTSLSVMKPPCPPSAAAWVNCPPVPTRTSLPK